MKVRTRYAPSPTGRMHVGNLRTALYAYLIAKHEGGDFLLRIEDTDQERYVEGAVDIIYRTMAETGLIHDEGPDKDGGCGPYVQSERQASGIYMEYAKKLVEKGEAYYCFCTPERLESLRTNVNGEEIMSYDKHCLHLSKEEIEANLAAGKPFVIRQNNPTTGTTTFHDEIYGDITVDNSELDDMVLIKSDGYPTYNFANVVDDHLMGITHVVRGNEYLSSSPKYNRLYDAFGWEVPVYVHCPLITDENHKKLSKRCGHSSYEDLIEQGFLSEAVVNYVALLGWSPSDNREIFSLEDLVEAFDYRHMSKSPAVFDPVKLKWMNGEYMKAMEEDKFYENGMVRESVMRQVHLGGRLPDSLSLSQKTYELDTQTTVSAVSDLTKGLYSKDTIMQKAIEIQGASEIDVDFDKELKNLVQKGALLKNEGREVEKLLMNNNPDDGVTGGATLWKLTQGITAFAREQQPERCRELHEISGQLMNRVKVN